MSKLWWIPVTAVLAVALAGGAVWGMSADTPDSSQQDPSEEKNEKGVVVGTVTDADGEAVEGALVAPEPIDNQNQPIPEIGVLTSEDGSYKWTLPPGDYEITINLEGDELGSETLTVKPDQTTNGDITVE